MRLFPMTFLTLALSITGGSLLSGHATANTVASTAAEQLYQPQPAEMQPQLAATGKQQVGVTSLRIINPAQLNLLTQQKQDREMLLEVWYPAEKTLETGALAQQATYDNVTKSHQPFSIQANALRDAKAKTDQKYPLVVLSHGYVGYRTLMFYLAEHLASHGYVVAAIDHPQSTNAEVDAIKAPYAGFPATLYHRSRDQQFVLSYFREHPKALEGVINTDAAAVIGYSMGGYGAINTVGGCFNFTEQSVQAFTGSKEQATNAALKQLLNSCAGGQYPKTAAELKVDSAWKAAIAIAPWGGQHKLFSAETLAAIKVPMLYFAGDQDDVSGYEGMQWLYNQTGRQDSNSKYMLTYHNARHNIAPHPAPAIARQNKMDFGHYHDASWSAQSINNINKHFALAMLDCHVKAISKQCEYLKLAPTPMDATAAKATESSSGWLGFPARYDTGLSWQYQLQK
jgi:predicted dienelactone hydrolase